MSDYQVKSGDSLWKIVQKEFKLKNNSDILAKVYEIAELNNIEKDKINNIFVGQNLKLDKEPVVTQEKKDVPPKLPERPIFTAQSCIFTDQINNPLNDIYIKGFHAYPDLHLSTTSNPEQQTVRQNRTESTTGNSPEPEETVPAVTTPPTVRGTEAPVAPQETAEVAAQTPAKNKKPTRLSPAKLSVTTKFDGTAEDIDKYLDGVLRGYGYKFLELQDKYDINAAFLAAIVINECDNGKSPRAKRTFNVAGIRYKNSFKFRTYQSVDLCLEDMAELLKNKYIDEGRTNVATIGSKYCPVSDPTDTKNLNRFWPRNVASHMNDILTGDEKAVIAS